MYCIPSIKSEHIKIKNNPFNKETFPSFNISMKIIKGTKRIKLPKVLKSKIFDEV